MSFVTRSLVFTLIALLYITAGDAQLVSPPTSPDGWCVGKNIDENCSGCQGKEQACCNDSMCATGLTCKLRTSATRFGPSYSWVCRE